MTNIIEIKDLNFTYGDKKIYDNFSLSIEKGSFLTIVGATGSGKSVLVRILLGLLPFEGQIKVMEHNLNDNNVETIRKKINVLFENSDSQFIMDTVEQELIVSLDRFYLKDDEIFELILSISTTLEITHLLKRNPHKLSAGEKQLVSLGCALVSQPDILLLDEALSMIDNCARNKVLKVLKNYNKKGMTIINITHNPEDILFGTDLMILKDGKSLIHNKVEKALKCEKEFISGNINMPFIADLCIKLNYYNVISKMELDKIKLVNTIWK